MARLTSRWRNRLPARDFALPSRRAYPIEDAVHARDASARASEAFHRGRITRAERDEIERKADRVMARNSASGMDWKTFSGRALRQGKTLQEASRAWHEGNRQVFGNPHGPERVHRTGMHQRIGHYLREGYGFHEAWRLARDENAGGQRDERRVWRGGDDHEESARNPTDNTLFMVLMGAGVLLLLVRGGYLNTHGIASSAPATTTASS